MKKIGRFLLNTVIAFWLIAALFTTVCLLSYNEFKVTTFGNKTLLIIDSDELEPDVMEGDLLVVKRNSDNKINIGDKVFYYNSAKNTKVMVYNGFVQDKQEIDRKETTFVVDGEKVSGEFIIGRVDSSKAYHKIGTILNIFTSKWGFMFMVILPTLFAIIYEIMMIFDTAQKTKTEKKVNQE